VTSEPLILDIGRQQTIVDSFKAASAEWCKYRDSNDLGSSESPAVFVFQGGSKLARISYNGRVWNLDGTEIDINAEGESS